jgi:hypothetical protein
MLYLDMLGLELPMHVTHVHCQDFIARRQGFRCAPGFAG